MILIFLLKSYLYRGLFNYYVLDAMREINKAGCVLMMCLLYCVRIQHKKTSRVRIKFALFTAAM